MKRNLRTILSTAVFSVWAFSVIAQDNPQKNPPDYSRDRWPQTRRTGRLNEAAKASDIIGMTVKNYQDEKLGKVEDLAVDVESGRIVEAILSVGGFLGLGDHLTAVPPGALHHDAVQKVFHLDANKERLNNAPKFELSKWSECCDSNHLCEVYRYYGLEPTFMRTSEMDVNSKQFPNTPRAETEKNWVASERHWMIPASRLSQIQKASKVMGTTVKNLQDEKLGKVDNLLLDLPSGRMVAVIISSGGFLGIGDELSAVPPTALTFNAEGDALRLDATKDSLTRAPHFKADEWPNFNDPIYAYEIYRVYKVEPYFSTNVTEVDNTRINVRDRNDQTVLPFDQGNSKADLDITAQIRKQVIATKDMSTYGKNVKIVSNNGRVALRGPVRSEEEKRIIGEIATGIATGAVDNRLEVKPSKDNY
jgi:sporulation protein YlmC with PRC-barrel domain